MGSSPAGTQRWCNLRRLRQLRHAGRQALVGIAAALGLVSAPVVAQAQPPAPTPPTGAAACALVSALDVSYVVGWTVPAPEARSGTQIFDKRDNISGAFTDCTYGSLTSNSPTSFAKVVIITYEALSAPVPAAFIKSDLKAELGEIGGIFKVTRYNGLGHPAWLLRGTSAGQTAEELVVIKDGQYLAGAIVFSSLSKVRLAALAGLAEKFYFPLTP
ncbi:MAG TPA: hypothetical protein VME46_22870 [Acidimicrobiales bacterium]|nr:hypothetical protein [Acidimicrobiales bacterium]